MPTWFSQLGTKATRTDLWVLGILSVLIWSLVKGDTAVMLTVAGYMAADIIGNKAIEAHKEIKLNTTNYVNESPQLPEAN